MIIRNRYNIVLYLAEIKTRRNFKEIYKSYSFNSADITPSAYMVAFIFKKVIDLHNAENIGLTTKINTYFKKCLEDYHYPKKCIKDCTFASQEECNAETNGNWYYYFK